MLGIALKILGAGAWVPALFLLYDRFCKKSILIGKLVSLTESDKFTFEYKDKSRNPQTIVGLGVIGKLHIQAKYKDFIINDVKAFVKIIGSEAETETHIIWTKNVVLDFNGVKKRLSIPSERYIKFISHIKEGVPNQAYFNCLVPQSSGSNWDWIRFDFFDTSNNVQSIKIRKTDLDMMCMLFENEIWIPET